jgi:phosphate acetyltransferase
MDPVERARAQGGSVPRSIVLPEGTDPTIQEAAVALAKTGRVRPIVLDAPAGLADRLAPYLPDPEACTVADCCNDPRCRRYAELYAARHDIPREAAEIIVRRPLYFAAMMVAEGDAHGMVAGILSATEDVIVATHLAIGREHGAAVPCSFYLLDIPGREGDEGQLLAFTDPAMNPRPDASELADIATAVAAAVEAMLGWNPRVALLSFSTYGSADDPAVDVVRDACDALRTRGVTFAFDGEMQADAALDERVARRKLGDSPVGGHANILVCPNLDAANIGAKLIQHFTGATAYGPFLLGFAAPVSDLSRSATLDDVVGTALLVASLPLPGPRS